MTFPDAMNYLAILISLIGLASWLVKLRRWPLIVAAVVALLANIAFYIARSSGLFTPVDLNIFSSARVLLLSIVVAGIPWSVRKSL